MHWMSAAVLMLSLFAASGPAQESAAPLDAPLVTLSRYDRYGLLVDLDHDGFMDAVSWWWTGPDPTSVDLRGWRNDGTGKLVLAWSTTVSVTSTSGLASSLRILPCNLDSDGSTDFYLVFTASGTASIRGLRSRGLTAPELVDDYSVSWTGLPQIPRLHAVVADFTGDARADLAYTFNGNLSLLEFVPGQPGLTLRSSTDPFGGPDDTVYGLMEVDANGDDTPDLLAWRFNTIKLIEVEGCQPMATQTFAQGINGFMPAMGDLDLDGDLDLVIWNDSHYVVLRRTAAATWSLEAPVIGGPAEFLVDVDQDGDLDGVCCGGGGDPQDIYVNTGISTMRVAVNDGTGAFAPSLEIPWLGSDHLAGIADLDHDGDLDVVSGRCILYARGPLTERLYPLLGSQKTDRSTADLDGDGDPDFAVGLRTNERNLGDASFSANDPSFPAPPPGTQFVGPGWPGDFDGDADVDLVVKHFAGATLLGQRLLANLGGGAFADAGEAGPSGEDFNPGIPNADAPESSFAGDADGDGDDDLITLTTASVPLRSLVWWNDGAGHFTAGPELMDEVVHWIGDLTGDGIPDLAVVSDWLHNSVGWHEGLGGGAFGPFVALTRFDIPYYRHRFLVADLDADGDCDFAVTYRSWLTFYWNDGEGVFTEEVSSVPLLYVPALPERHGVWSTDVDDDGRRDLLITPSQYERNGVIVLRRKTDNSGWEAPFSQIVYQIVYGSIIPDAVVCDVDGDGDDDFVTDRLIRNGTHSLPEAGQRRQVGAGTSGTGGLVPTLGADGPFRVGESAELLIRGGAGGATGLLTITLVNENERGPSGPGRITASNSERILAQIPFSLSGADGTAGTGSWGLPYTVGQAFVNETRRYVAKIFDAGAPGGVARSNALLIHYGPNGP